MDERYNHRELHLLGVSFRNAPAAVREGLHFTRSQAAALLREAASCWPDLEALILSTCNRTEFYLAAPPDSGVDKKWLGRLRALRPEAQILHTDCARYQSTGEEAARHLIRVACGLDSAVLGDIQILGQIKDAHALARESDSLGAYLNRLVQLALRAGKQARAKTRISQGAASVGSALVRMAQHRFSVWPEEKRPKVVLLGAGKIARDIARYAVKRDLGELTILNRTDRKAMELANHCGADSLPWSTLRDALRAADVVITATSATRPVLERAFLKQIAAERAGRPLLIMDAGMPRNVEPGSSFEVIDIDAIRERQENVLSQRKAAVPAVESIVHTETGNWKQWTARRPLEGLIKTLYQEASAQSRAAAHDLAKNADTTLEEAEQVFYRSFRKLLHGHVNRLRSWGVPQELGVES